ncbi:hypothetical protein ACFLS9_07095 [Bacteroidota bacterium]
MKKFLFTILIICITVFISGCSVSKATLSSFVDPNISNEELNSIAVFPIRNARFAPNEAKQINKKISTEIHNLNKDIQIMSSDDVINILNEYDLASSWAMFLDNYSSSGIPDKYILYEIGEVLNVDCLVQGEVVNIFQEDGEFGINNGLTTVTVMFSLISTKSGKILWEASSDGTKKTVTSFEDAPPIMEAVNLAVDKILSNLPL